MSEPEIDRGRSAAKIKSLEDRITELERVIKAVVKAMVEIEDELDVGVMPEGTYCGHDFKS